MAALELATLADAEVEEPEEELLFLDWYLIQCSTDYAKMKNWFFSCSSKQKRMKRSSHI